MPEVIGIDHIYIAVSDMEKSEHFYDVLFGVLGFRKQHFAIADENHIQYYNRHFGYVLRPARTGNGHDPHAPGLHHLCFRVEGEADVQQAANRLKLQHIAVTEPRLFPEYAPDYFAMFLTDPDGLRLEITNYRAERRERHDNWDSVSF